MVAEGNLFAALTTGGAYQNFGPAADIYDVSAILNPDTGLANVLANFTDAKADGRETLNGVETVRVTGPSAPTQSTRSRPRSEPPGPYPPPPGFTRTATTSWCRRSWSRAPATASR